MWDFLYPMSQSKSKRSYINLFIYTVFTLNILFHSSFCWKTLESMFLSSTSSQTKETYLVSTSVAEMSQFSFFISLCFMKILFWFCFFFLWTVRHILKSKHIDSKLGRGEGEALEGIALLFSFPIPCSLCFWSLHIESWREDWSLSGN